jgi:hypothetical protein
MLTNMHNPPTDGHLCNDHRNAVKFSIVEDMGFVDMAQRKFVILNLTVLNNYILLSSCGGEKITQGPLTPTDYEHVGPHW